MKRNKIYEKDGELRVSTNGEIFGEEKDSEIFKNLENLSQVEIGSASKGCVLRFLCTLDVMSFSCLWNDKKVKEIICTSKDGSIITINKKNYDYCIATRIATASNEEINDVMENESK